MSPGIGSVRLSWFLEGSGSSLDISAAGGEARDACPGAIKGSGSCTVEVGPSVKRMEVRLGGTLRAVLDVEAP